MDKVCGVIRDAQLASIAASRIQGILIKDGKQWAHAGGDQWVVIGPAEKPLNRAARRARWARERKAWKTNTGR